MCEYLDQKVRTKGEQNGKSFKVVSKTKKKKEIDEEIESGLSFYYPFPVVENSLEKCLQMYFMVRFRDFKWKGTKISTLILEAKYYFLVKFYNKVCGLFRFKFSKLTYRNTEWHLSPFSIKPSCASLLPASTPRGFCLIKYLTLIRCFNTVLWNFFSVKYTICEAILTRR